MDTYFGHICAPTCNMKMPITCWSYLNLWDLNCLKDRTDIRIWIEHYKLIPNSKIFFGNDSCFRFLCPICITKRFNGEIIIQSGDSRNETAARNSNDLKLELSNLSSMISMENAELSKKMDDIKNILFSQEQQYVNMADQSINKINDVLEAKNNHLASFIGSHFEKTTNQLNTNQQNNIQQISDVVASIHTDVNPNKRRRVTGNQADEVFDMSMSNDLSDIIHIDSENGENNSDNIVPVDLHPRLKTLSTCDEKIKYKYELCVSKFKPDESERNIVAHILHRTRIDDENLFNVTKLVRSNAKLNKLTFISLARI